MSRVVPRETSPTVKVMLPLERAAGIRAVGPYKPGIEYDVSSDEARRLIDVKGFVAVGGPVAASPAAATAANTED